MQEDAPKSFDLFFAREEDSFIAPQTLEAWARANWYFRVERLSADDRRLLYENENTGVRFTIEYSRPSVGAAREAWFPKGYTNAGLSLTIGVLRPSFFAREAMPIVEELATEFSLLIIDPQDAETPGAGFARDRDSAELIASWRRSNVLALESAPFLNPPLPRMAEEKALAWWRYMRDRGRMQERFGREIFVPKVLLGVKKGSPDAVTAITWDSGIPLVIPPVDLVIFIRVKRWKFGLFPRKVMGFVDAAELMKELAPHLEDLGAGEGLKVLRPEQADKVANLHNTHKIDEKMDDLALIKADGFVDVEQRSAPQCS